MGLETHLMGKSAISLPPLSSRPRSYKDQQEGFGRAPQLRCA